MDFNNEEISYLPRHPSPIEIVSAVAQDHRASIGIPNRSDFMRWAARASEALDRLLEPCVYFSLSPTHKADVDYVNEYVRPLADCSVV
jgi:hypothetical protein